MIALAKRIQMDPDTQLMVSVRDGDLAAFDELYQRHRSRVIGLITHLMGSSSDSEDLAQQVFFRVFHGRDSYVPTARFSTWLFTITKNVALNARRGCSRRHEFSIQAGSDLGVAQFFDSKRSWEQDPQEAAVQAEILHAVSDAIGRLGRLQQQAIRLVYFQGFRYSAAAEQMDLTEDSVRRLLYRGKKKLRLLLQPCVDVHAFGEMARRFPISRVPDQQGRRSLG